jgi:4'-phosphopantetheinyl transferase
MSGGPERIAAPAAQRQNACMIDSPLATLRWNPVDAPPHLTGPALHLWRIPLRQGSDRSDSLGLQLLCTRQRQRMQRLRSAEHRQRYLRTQVGCRRILALYLDIDPTAISFGYGSAGKPTVASHDRMLEFNLTNSGDLALLAVSAREPVGVDCELERARGNLLAIARRMFAPEAQQALAELPPATRLRVFHLHWTALEARVKADGRGLARHREPDPPDLDIAHAIADEIDGRSAICAVARRALPPSSQWQALQLQC